MLYGIFADVHGNMDGFQIALKRLTVADKIIFLGDLFQPYTDPEPLLRSLAETQIHFVLGEADLRHVDGIRQALPPGHVAKQYSDGVVACFHANPLDTLQNAERFGIDGCYDAEFYLRCFSEPVAFVGHTHTRRIFEKRRKAMVKERPWLSQKGVYRIQLRRPSRYIINPGVAGRVPDVSVALYDSDRHSLVIFATGPSRAILHVTGTKNVGGA